MPVLTESHVVRLHPVQFEIHIPSRAGSARPTALMSSRRFVVAVLVVSKSCHRLHSRHDSYAPGGRAPCQDLSQNLEQESRGKNSSKTILPTPFGGPRKFARGRVPCQDSSQNLEQESNLRVGGRVGNTIGPRNAPNPARPAFPRPEAGALYPPDIGSTRPGPDYSTTRPARSPCSGVP